jgi:hypothetical protein
MNLFAPNVNIVSACEILAVLERLPPEKRFDTLSAALQKGVDDGVFDMPASQSKANAVIAALTKRGRTLRGIAQVDELGPSD